MRGVPLTPKQRQQIIDLRHSSHTYKVSDPAGIFKPSPVEWNQCDLAAMLELSNLPNGFTLTISHHHIQVQHGTFIRDDGYYCTPNHSSVLKWYKPKGVE